MSMGVSGEAWTGLLFLGSGSGITLATWAFLFVLPGLM